MLQILIQFVDKICFQKIKILEFILKNQTNLSGKKKPCIESMSKTIFCVFTVSAEGI